MIFIRRLYLERIRNVPLLYGWNIFGELAYEKRVPKLFLFDWQQSTIVATKHWSTERDPFLSVTTWPTVTVSGWAMWSSYTKYKPTDPLKMIILTWSSCTPFFPLIHSYIQDSVCSLNIHFVNSLPPDG